MQPGPSRLVALVVLSIVAPLSAQKEPARPVERGGVVLEAKGHAAARLVRWTSEGGGRVVKIHFEEGQKVNKGAVLVQLDNRMAQAEFEKAAATLKQERAALNEMRN